VAAIAMESSLGCQDDVRIFFAKSLGSENWSDFAESCDGFDFVGVLFLVEPSRLALNADLSACRRVSLPSCDP
jgi:hypothetical protein